MFLGKIAKYLRWDIFRMKHGLGGSRGRFIDILLFLTGLFYCVKYGIVNFVLHYIKYKNKRKETRK